MDKVVKLKGFPPTTKVSVTVFGVDGNVEQKTLHSDGNMLEQLQSLVGGFLEVIGPRMAPFLRKGDCLVVNEDGRLIDLKPNPAFVGLVGNVVLMRYDDIP